MNELGICWQEACIRFGQPQEGIPFLDGGIKMPRPRDVLHTKCSECNSTLSRVGSKPLVRDHER